LEDHVRRILLAFARGGPEGTAVIQKIYASGHEIFVRVKVATVDYVAWAFRQNETK
jgi:hypothetical protein